MSPNGFQRNEKELSRLEKNFLHIGPFIEDFARQHGLRIKKYDHGVPEWRMEFTRKAGGLATITITFDEKPSGSFQVAAMWGLGDYPTEMERFRIEVIGTYNNVQENPQQITTLLTNTLNAVKGWGLADLNRSEGPIRWWKDRWKTKEDFQKRYKDYPLLEI